MVPIAQSSKIISSVSQCVAALLQPVEILIWVTFPLPKEQESQETALECGVPKLERKHD